MAKVKPGWAAPGAAPTSRGRFLIANHWTGPVAMKWPRRRGKAKSGYNFFRQKEFGIVARMAVNPVDLELATAIEMVKDTTYVPRDVLMSAAYGRFYEIQNEDGFIWPNVRDVTNNPQLILDQVTTEVGAILYRAEIGWVGLPPGNAGQVLTMQNGLPSWQDPQPLPPPPTPSPDLELAHNAVTTHNSNTVTFSSVPLGTADAARSIIVGIMGQRAGATGARSITAVTLEGAAMAAARTELQSGSQNVLNFYVLAEASLVDGDIAITYSGSVENTFIAVFAAYGLESLTPTDSEVNSGSNPGVAVDIAEGGMILGIAGTSGSAATDITWTGLSEAVELSTGAIPRFAAAAFADMAAETGHAVTVTSSATTEGLLVASFR